MSDYDDPRPNILDVEDAAEQTRRDAKILREKLETLDTAAHGRGETRTCALLPTIYHFLGRVEDGLSSTHAKLEQLPWR